jgi:hypothetical protein
MGASRRKVFAALVLFALLAASATSVRHLRAQDGPIGKQSAVQTLTNRIPPAVVTHGDRGATYHALEQRTRQVITRFEDAVAVANRLADGQLRARVTDLAGNDVGSLRVHHVGSEMDSLEFSAGGKPSRHAARRSGLRPTLDWTNEQAYSLWKDGDAIDRSSLEWQDTLMRPSGAARRLVSRGALQTDIEWDDGLSATAIRRTGTHMSAAGRPTTGPVVISRFKKDGLEIGSVQWWPDEQLLAWTFPGLTEGYVDPTRLRAAGGWPLVPDMPWLNTQALAFYQFHTLVKEKGSVSQRREGWLEKIGSYVTPQLHANEPGCDYLHWLDGSIFRPCCDSHDLCYSKQDPACAAASWWMWWSSWRCDQCNIFVVACFMTGGGSHVFYRTA